MKAVLIALGVALGTCAGCATSPVSNADAVPVSRERILDPAYLENKPGTGQVTLKRDSGFLGGGCAARVFVNAVPVVELRTSEKAVLHLAPGEYIFSVQVTGRGLCKYSNTPEIRSTVAASDALTFRVAVEMGGLAIYPTAF